MHLGRRQQREAAERALRSGGEAAEQLQQVAEHAPDRGRLEAAALEADPQVERRDRDGEQVERIVGPLLDADLGDLEPSSALSQGALDRVVLEDEQALEQRPVPGQLTPALDLLERDVLVLPLLELLLLEPAEPGQERLVRAHRHPHRQRADEQAGHRLDAGQLRRPARDHRSEDKVRLAAVAVEQQRPGSLHQRVDGQMGAPRQRLQALGGLALEARLDAAGATLRAVRRLPVDRQRSGLGEAPQPLAPVALRRLPALALEPPDEIAEAARRRQLRPAPGDLGVIEGEDLAEEQRQRPAVEDQLMEGPDQAVAAGRCAQQRQAHQGRTRQLEGAQPVGAEEGGEPLPLLRLVQAAPILLPPGQLDLRADDRERPLPSLPQQEAAQGLVAVGSLLPGPPQRRRVEVSHQLASHLVDEQSRLPGVEHVEEEDALL